MRMTGWERSLLAAALSLHCLVLLAATCTGPIDIRDTVGVQTDKLHGSRVEYDPFPGNFKIVPGLSIKVEFKTTDPKGLLLLTGNFKAGDLIAAYLTDGRLIFARRCGHGRAFELYPKRLDDGKWHTVVFIHNRKGGQLLIDNHKPFRQYHLGVCADFTSVLFGGLSPHVTVNRWKGVDDDGDRFAGCLRNMRIDKRIPALHPDYHAVSRCRS